MDGRLGAVRATGARAAGSALPLLEEWLRIPSVSGSAAHAADVERAARWVADRLRQGTPYVGIRRTPAGPVVVARTLAGGDRRAPMTVVYGHLDVKPPGPGWTSPPFRPTRIGHRLQARGASDDKGQVMAHLVALAAWSAAGGPPGDVVTIIDGTEEVGSTGLARALAPLRRGPLAGPVAAVVVVDTRAAGPGRPTVTVSQRGAALLRVSVDVGGSPVHAGRLGGAVVDPSLVLAAALTRAAAALAALAPGCTSPAALPTEAGVRAAAGPRSLHAGDLVAGVTRRGTLTVSRLRASAATGAVPTRATADVDLRLPPGRDPRRELPGVVRSLRRGVPPGTRLQVAAGHGTPGLCLAPPPAVRAAVRAACRAGYGRAPVAVASGGSIPAVAVLAHVFGQAPVLLGLGPADDGAHGPDEYLDLRDWRPAVDTHVVLLAAIVSDGRKPYPEGILAPFVSATVENEVGTWGSRSAECSGVT